MIIRRLWTVLQLPPLSLSLATISYFDWFGQQSPPLIIVLKLHQAMDLLSSKFFHSPSTFENMEPPKGNPFANTFTDPLCDLNLKETSDFVKSFPTGNTSYDGRNFQASLQRRREGVNSVTQMKALEAPPTPGRPIFSFSVRNPSRKTIPSKWDNAEKWLMNSSCTDSSGHGLNPVECRKFAKECDNIKQQTEVVAEKFEVKVSNTVSSFDTFNGGSDVLLKDRFADDRGLEQSKEGFQFKNTVNVRSAEAGKEVSPDAQHIDAGTEMTPIGSTTTSRCHTPFKTTSPARHNTPANRSSLLAIATAVHGNAVVDISQLQECHLTKLHLGSQYDSIASNWSSMEEEEEISKSLRHFETGKERREGASDSKAAVSEEDQKSESCLRYQREEAKIQAWVNLQNAKAEAQSRKLEVKIQKMRSNLEEKLMKKMGIVYRKAEERRAEARQQHAEQMQKVSDEAKKMINGKGSVFSGQTSCGCFPCNN